MNTQEIVTASHHEVGHALLSYHVGFLFEFFELQFNGTEFDRGRIRYDFKGIESNSENGLLRIQCALGGPIAQTIFEKGILNLNRPEFESDRKVINDVLTGASLEEWKNLVDKQIVIVQAFLEESQSMEARKSIAQELFQSRKISYQKFINLAKKYNVRTLVEKPDLGMFPKTFTIISENWRKAIRFLHKVFSTKL